MLCERLGTLEVWIHDTGEWKRGRVCPERVTRAGGVSDECVMSSS